MASVWQDNKPVTMLSTLAQADVTHIAQRKMSRASVQCTDAVVLYNQYIFGVNKGDQLRQYYRVRMRTTWFLFDVSITNRYILSLYAPTSMALSLKLFRLKLAKQLVGDYNSRKHLGRPRFVSVHPPPELPPPQDHGPLPPTASRTTLHLPSKLHKKRRCMYCLHSRTPPR